MKKLEKVELTNMCMVYDDNGNILVQDRVKNWKGITFPGGHIEKGESFVNSVIREVKEETGLDIEKPRLCGVKQFVFDYENEKIRYIVFFFKTNKFSGKIVSSDEGKIFWINKKDLKNYELSNDFDKMFEVFDNDNLTECFYDDNWDLEIL